ncbi:hypothetical protein HDU97_008873 [Phlyctochytrium planicorne]|nr:hypothetical protein HDU97_008873 [Phlyctochytrium planicorne]
MSLVITIPTLGTVTLGPPPIQTSATSTPNPPATSTVPPPQTSEITSAIVPTSTQIIPEPTSVKNPTDANPSSTANPNPNPSPISPTDPPVQITVKTKTILKTITQGTTTFVVTTEVPATGDTNASDGQGSPAKSSMPIGIVIAVVVVTGTVILLGIIAWRFFINRKKDEPLSFSPSMTGVRPFYKSKRLTATSATSSNVVASTAATSSAGSVVGSPYDPRATSPVPTLNSVVSNPATPPITTATDPGFIISTNPYYANQMTNPYYQSGGWQQEQQYDLNYAYYGYPSDQQNYGVVTTTVAEHVPDVSQPYYGGVYDPNANIQHDYQHGYAANNAQLEEGQKRTL